jgi:glycine dehydrogenase subunit 1
MQSEKPIVYPYIPNSVPEIKEQMLDTVAANSIEDFFEEIPDKLRIEGSMNLPPPLLSEYALKKHVQDLLYQNKSTDEYINFLGAGCYQHHVPAICDEINSRGEFLTAYAGEPYDDHGRFQALFEYTSMMGELLEMDVVNVPTYDGYQASATALRMASRLTGRKELLISKTISPGKLSKIMDYCQPGYVIKTIGFEPETGLLDLEELTKNISIQTAAVYFENPAYLGFIETQGDKISDIAHQNGALCVVGVDPLSLGVLSPPVNYGADIVCGDIQSLGIHMQYGGGHAGFIATQDDDKFVMEYPSRLFGIAPTVVEGEYGFGDVAYERTSFAVREKGKEWVGTAAALWGITAGVYLALMGPQGMLEIGEGIMTRAKYAMLELDKVDGVIAPLFQTHHFQEFVINFDECCRDQLRITGAEYFWWKGFKP